MNPPKPPKFRSYVHYDSPAQWPQLPPRNSPCPCGRRKKFKHCCLKVWEQKLAKARKEPPNVKEEAYPPAQAPKPL